MKWLSNTYKEEVVDVPIGWAGLKQQARWLHKPHVIGRPQATSAYTVEELETMGMVGVYEEDEN